MAITGSQVAYRYAMSGSTTSTMRSGTSRSGYTTPKMFLSIAGTHYATGKDSISQFVLDGSLTINLNQFDTPDTATFTVKGFHPTCGQTVNIRLGSKNNLDLLFRGLILSTTDSYVGTPANYQVQVNAIDHTWGLGRRLVTAVYTSESASDIAEDLISFAPGYSAASVEAGLATIDSFSVTNETVLNALKRLAKRAGVYFDVVGNKVVYFGTNTLLWSDPVSLTSAHVSLSDFQIQKDMSQVVTREWREGGGVNTLAPAVVGDTILAVQDIAWYGSAGGLVVVGPQRLTYTGYLAATGGAVVGPGASPASAIGATGSSGAGVTAGAHYWAYTFVTGAGESLPSPISNTVTMRTLSTPSAPTVVNTSDGFSGPGTGVAVSYKLSVSADSGRFGETSLGSAAGVTGNDRTVNVSFVVTSDMIGGYVNVYRSDDGSAYALRQQIGPFGPTFPIGLTYTIYDYSTTFSGPGAVSSGGTIGQAMLYGVAIGGTGTTSRKIYRTAAAGSQLKLVATIANNTSTSYTDSTADGSLGANVPTSDTSGLTQTTGQVVAGSVSLITSGSGPFSTTGGWAVIGNGSQVLRYAGITDNTLTGIPASGVGAIQSTISYNSSVTPAPTLLGIPASGPGAITAAINIGEQVNVLVRCDDTAAQTTIGTAIGGSDDGVIEEYVSDGRISEAECLARGTASLVLKSTILETITWKSRDPNTRPPRIQAVSLTTPTTVSASYAIQRVTVTNFVPSLWPTFAATASSTRFSFEDLLRQARS